MTRGLSPGVRRRANIALHWPIALVLLAMIKGGTQALWLRWAYVALAVLWLGLTMWHGLHATPGPKLKGTARRFFAPMHWAMHGLVALSALLNVAELSGLVAPGPAWISLLVLLSAAAFHAIFHIWRHAALYDNALRRILPRFTHKYL